MFSIFSNCFAHFSYIISVQVLQGTLQLIYADTYSSPAYKIHLHLLLCQFTVVLFFNHKKQTQK